MFRSLFRVELQRCHFAQFRFGCASTRSHPFSHYSLGKYGVQRHKLPFRTLFRSWSASANLPSTKSYGGQDDSEFADVFPEIVKFLSDWNPDVMEANEWLALVLAYNIPPDPQRRGVMLTNVFQVLTKEEATREEQRLAHIMGWCVDMWTASLNTYHDTIDQDAMRDGRESWHMLAGLGNGPAINDAILLKSSAHATLAEYFRGKPCYKDVTDLFLEAARLINIGKHLELWSTNSRGRPLFSLFNRKHYDMVSLHKAGYGYCYLPFMSAVHLAGFTDTKVLAKVEQILIQIGMLQQVKKDFLNCFGERPVGDKDSDCSIAKGKCTWLAVKVLERADDHQRDLLQECYGYPDAEKVSAVKNLYEELALPSLFNDEKAAMEERLLEDILSISREVPPEAFGAIQNTYSPGGSPAN